MTSKEPTITIVTSPPSLDTSTIDDVTTLVSNDYPSSVVAVTSWFRGEPSTSLHVLLYSDDTLQGWAYLRRDTNDAGEWEVDVFVTRAFDPDVRLSWGTRLVTEGMSNVQATQAIFWGNAANETATAVAGALDGRLQRTILQMSRPLVDDDLQFFSPSIRPYRPNDATEVARVDAAAFAWHPDRRHRTVQDLHDDMHALGECYDDLLLLAPEWSGGAPIGFCWVKPFTDQTGEAYVMAVDPQARANNSQHGSAHKSLGSILMRAGFRRLREHYGFETCVLYVEEGNEYAISLYQRLGFSFTGQVLRSWAISQ